MKKFISKFFKEEDGMGTVEIIIIIGVLVAIALIFSGSIKNLVSSMISKVNDAGNAGVDEALS